MAELWERVRTTEESRGVLISTPESVKSALLRSVEGCLYPKNQAAAATALQKIFVRWTNGCFLIDEIDTVMNPLRSELNFPIGAEKLIDIGCARWRLPMALLSAAPSATRRGGCSEGRSSVPPPNACGRRMVPQQYDFKARGRGHSNTCW